MLLLRGIRLRLRFTALVLGLRDGTLLDATCLVCTEVVADFLRIAVLARLRYLFLAGFVLELRSRLFIRMDAFFTGDQ